MLFGDVSTLLHVIIKSKFEITNGNKQGKKTLEDSFCGPLNPKCHTYICQETMSS